MNELQLLRRKIEELETQIHEFKRNRFRNLSSQEVEQMKNYLFDRTAATLASGASVRYVIMSINGVRKAIPTYNKFQPLV
jgi:uridylate kinase